jgi:hypothetical protein
VAVAVLDGQDSRQPYEDTQVLEIPMS